MSKLPCKYREVTNFFRIWCIVNSIYKSVLPFALFYFVNECGYSLVGKKHKLFDELMRVFPDFWYNGKGFPFFIQLEFYFGRFKIHCSFGESLLAQFYSKLV